jgi:uncharacterized protein
MSSQAAAVIDYVQLSAQIFVIPLEPERFIVYAPLRRAAFVADDHTVDFLAVLRDGFIDREADPDGSLIGFLRQIEIVDGGPEPLPVTVFAGPPKPTTVTLFLTTACNLRCTYCYASAGEIPLESMSLDVATRGIDFVAANALEKGEACFEIAYHGGGEPTVHWRVLTQSLEYARRKAAQLGLQARASSATNGVMTDGQLDWVVRNLDGVSLSFDGSPQAHDRHRLTVLGQASSGRVMHAMRFFDAAGFPYGVRVTVTADEIAALPDSIDFLCANFHPRRVQVEPVYNLGRWSGAPSAETELFVAAYRAAQKRALRSGFEIGYSAARVGYLTNHFCGVSQDGFALSPAGDVSGCYEVFSRGSPWADVFFYARPAGGDAGYRFELPVLNNLRAQAVGGRAFCAGCFAGWTCAGDCYHKSLNVGGRGEFAGSDRCHITRELTKDQILAKIAAAGGLFWHEGSVGPAGHTAGKEFLS